MDFRTANPGDIDAIAELERSSYPVDEAASVEKFEFRLRVAPQLCRVGLEMGRVVGFVSGTAISGAHLTQESMTTHDPSGDSVCIHSVVVEASRRRCGLGLGLVSDYCAHVGRLGEPVKRIVLICKSHLIGFYEDAGFAMVGPSSVIHGSDPWFEMARPVG